MKRFPASMARRSSSLTQSLPFESALNLTKMAWIGFAVLALCVLVSPKTLAATHCTSVDDDLMRLACYDAFFALDRAALGEPLEDDEIATELVATPRPTALDHHLLMEADVVDNTFAIAPHRPNYILPLTHNFDANFDEYGLLGRTFTDEEIKMQISLKTPLARGLWRGSSVWFGYTQQSYWQLYAEDFASAPFRETNYQPEVYWEMPVSHELLGWRARLLRLGINHQSNGQTERLSRSWNRVVGEAVFDRGNLVGTIKAWHRIEEDAEDDDNPDLEDFMGRAQFGLSYKRGDQTYSINVINNLRTSENRSGVELNWTFPLVQQLKGYIQFYSGYGENMIDAENYTNRIGIGFSLNDWL